MRYPLIMSLLIIIFLSAVAFTASTYFVGFQGEPFLAPEKIVSSFDGKFVAVFGTAFPDQERIPFVMKLDDQGKFVNGKLFHFEEAVFQLTATIATSDNGYMVVGGIGDSEESSIIALKLTTNGSIQWKM